MNGILFSMLGGILISLQSVFNTRASEKIGLWATNVIVHGSGLCVATLIMFLAGDSTFQNIHDVNKLYFLGGTMGVIIVFSIITGISLLGTTLPIAILLIVQLITAATIDNFGLFGSAQKHFDPLKYIGIAVMIAGIVIFKWKD